MEKKTRWEKKGLGAGEERGGSGTNLKLCAVDERWGVVFGQVTSAGVKDGRAKGVLREVGL